MELDKAILMQKQVKDNSDDLQSEFLDLKNWEEQMKRKEKELLSECHGQQVLPPVRSKHKKKCVIKNSSTAENPKRIKSYDYKSWDKFDIDKACNELDKEEESEYSSEETMTKEELERDHNKAIEHKQQGNVFVQQQKWDKAIASYSEAIKIFPYDAIFYANRAFCYLKQDNLYAAEADCSSAIQLDKTYVKAYHRRATARMELKQFKEAKQDIEKILMLEPSNKEAKVLLQQVNKKLENLKPVIISGEDISEDISIEKKIGEKILGNLKSHNKVIKEDKDKKNSMNAETIPKPIIIKEAKINQCIPDWLPEKDNVEIAKSVEKPPHLRSKEPLKKILVQETDLIKPFKEEIKASCNKSHVKSDIHSDNTTKCKEIITKSKSNESFTESCMEIPSIPKTAVQFLIHWRKYNSSDFRYKYLKQILPDSLPKIFQDSMESDIFSDILTTLKTEFMKREEPIFLYLKNLSDVKRFRAFIMFISSSEKEDLKLMFSYCKSSEKISEEEITKLQNKYEI